MTSVTITLSEKDAGFAVTHLRYLADRETATEEEHAAANLTARWLADQIEEGRDEPLTAEQTARLEALQKAAPLIKKTSGPFGPTAPADVPELVDLAEYIIAGVHPMARYAEENTE